MDIYLAGAITGNLINDWKKSMQIYLASLANEKGRLIKKVNEEKELIIYLAGNGVSERLYPIKPGEINVLESFYYIQKKEWIFPLINKFNNFMLDSGAFTFMNNNKGIIDWEQYIEDYAKFINKYDVKYFFELDIDNIVGLEEVERLRNKLETLTNKRCIPVWHVSRGYKYWLKMCEEYDYVAIGGIVTKEINKRHYPAFTKMIIDAHKRGAKVHGLGFTNLKGLETYPFDSVDSTSWTSGNRFGALYKFNGKTMIKQNKKEGQRVKTNETASNNFLEWVKFSKYARKHL